MLDFSQGDAHAFFSAKLSPLLAAAPNGAAGSLRRDTRRPAVLATVAHPAEHALDPAVEEAGHELFAEIKQVRSCSFSFRVLPQHVSRQRLPLLKADRQPPSASVPVLSPAAAGQSEFADSKKLLEHGFLR